MIADSSEIEGDTHLQADVCVIGAGAAGITFALKLTEQNIKTILLEAGPLDAKEDVSPPYVGETEGWRMDDSYLVKSRVQGVGGTTRLWRGYCRPFDEFDLRNRHWLNGHEWPIEIDELTRHYPESAGICGVSNPLDGVLERFYSENSGHQTISTDCLVEKLFLQSTPATNFGSKFLPRLKADKSLRVIYNASCRQLIYTPDRRAVARVDVAAMETRGVSREVERSFSVSAKYVVLAAGGIENARILLVSQAGRERGPGNSSGLVGRYFMEHPFGRLGTFSTGLRADRLRFWSKDGEKAAGFWEKVKMVLMPTPEVQERLEILSFYLMFRRIALNNAEDGRKTSIFEFIPTFEQYPSIENRVHLVGEKDEHGVPRVRLINRINELDRRTFYALLKLFGGLVRDMGFGNFNVDAEDYDSWRGRYPNHHIGTTRMSTDPGAGVVNKDLRHHEIQNMYILGSSVFPTSTAINPTLTIVALALRLALHLRYVLR